MASPSREQKLSPAAMFFKNTDYVNNLLRPFLATESEKSLQQVSRTTNFSAKINLLEMLLHECPLIAASMGISAETVGARDSTSISMAYQRARRFIYHTGFQLTQSEQVFVEHLSEHKRIEPLPGYQWSLYCDPLASRQILYVDPARSKILRWTFEAVIINRDDDDNLVMSTACYPNWFERVRHHGLSSYCFAYYHPDTQQKNSWILFYERDFHQAKNDFLDLSQSGVTFIPFRIFQFFLKKEYPDLCLPNKALNLQVSEIKALWILSVKAGHLDLCARLFESNADLQQDTDQMAQAYHTSLRNGHLFLARYLFDKANGAQRAILRRYPDLLFQEVAARGHVDALQWMREEETEAKRDASQAIIAEAGQYHAFCQAVEYAQIPVLNLFWQQARSADQREAFLAAIPPKLWLTLIIKHRMEVIDWFQQQLDPSRFQGILNAIISHLNIITTSQLFVADQLEGLNWLWTHIDSGKKREVIGYCFNLLKRLLSGDLSYNARHIALFNWIWERLPNEPFSYMNIAPREGFRKSIKESILGVLYELVERDNAKALECLWQVVDAKQQELMIESLIHDETIGVFLESCIDWMLTKLDVYPEKKNLFLQKLAARQPAYREGEEKSQPFNISSLSHCSDEQRESRWQDFSVLEQQALIHEQCLPNAALLITLATPSLLEWIWGKMNSTQRQIMLDHFLDKTLLEDLLTKNISVSKLAWLWQKLTFTQRNVFNVLFIKNRLPLTLAIGESINCLGKIEEFRWLWSKLNPHEQQICRQEIFSVRIRELFLEGEKLLMIFDEALQNEFFGTFLWLWRKLDLRVLTPAENEALITAFIERVPFKEAPTIEALNWLWQICRNENEKQDIIDKIINFMPQLDERDTDRSTALLQWQQNHVPINDVAIPRP